MPTSPAVEHEVADHHHEGHSEMFAASSGRRDGPGKADFASLHVTINGSRFLYGDFINVLISFVSIAAARSSSSLSGR
jgi:hypothetical protein